MGRGIMNEIDHRCRNVIMRIFFSLCLSILKNTFMHINNVIDFICRWNWCYWRKPIGFRWSFISAITEIGRFYRQWCGLKINISFDIELIRKNCCCIGKRKFNPAVWDNLFIFHDIKREWWEKERKDKPRALMLN